MITWTRFMLMKALECSISILVSSKNPSTTWTEWCVESSKKSITLKLERFTRDNSRTKETRNLLKAISLVFSMWMTSLRKLIKWEIRFKRETVEKFQIFQTTKTIISTWHQACLIGKSKWLQKGSKMCLSFIRTLLQRRRNRCKLKWGRLFLQQIAMSFQVRDSGLTMVPEETMMCFLTLRWTQWEGA